VHTYTPEGKRCTTYVSPFEDSIGGYSHEPCLECGTSWYGHNNIGPGWRARSEARKIQLGLYPHIVLGEN